jgi:hypothetical protein
MHGEGCVSARQGWAGEKGDFFSIMPENPRQLSLHGQYPPSSGGAFIPSL